MLRIIFFLVCLVELKVFVIMMKILLKNGMEIRKYLRMYLFWVMILGLLRKILNIGILKSLIIRIVEEVMRKFIIIVFLVIFLVFLYFFVLMFWVIMVFIVMLMFFVMFVMKFMRWVVIV